MCAIFQLRVGCFFHRVPLHDEVKSVLKMEGLLSGLLLASACSYLTGFEPDEVTDANERLSKCWYKDAGEVEKLTMAGDLFRGYLLWAIMDLSLSVIMAVYTYISLAGINPES